jgi:hypothetical protein
MKMSVCKHSTSARDKVRAFLLMSTVRPSRISKHLSHTTRLPRRLRAQHTCVVYAFDCYRRHDGIVFSGIFRTFFEFSTSREVVEKEWRTQGGTNLGAISILFSATMRRVLRFRSHSSTIGCVVDAGMRASRTSTTTSTLLSTCKQ